MGVARAAVIAAAAALALGACYTVPEPDCGFVCGAGGACPSDYTCTSDNVCRRNGAAATTTCMVDAAVDAAPDAQFLDAPPDGGPTTFVVVSTSPASDETGVDAAAPITIGFNDSPQASTVANGFSVTTGGVNVEGYYETNDNVAIFTPDFAYAPGAIVDVSLGPGLISVSGNALMLYEFQFTAADYTTPAVISTTPAPDAVAVADDSSIVVVFSEAVMDVSTTSFNVATIGDVPIDGTIGASPDNTTYTFTPMAALPADTVISVVLSPAGAPIEDLAADVLPTTSFDFTTE